MAVPVGSRRNRDESEVKTVPEFCSEPWDYDAPDGECLGGLEIEVVASEDPNKNSVFELFVDGAELDSVSWQCKSVAQDGCSHGSW